VPSISSIITYFIGILSGFTGLILGCHIYDDVFEDRQTLSIQKLVIQKPASRKITDAQLARINRLKVRINSVEEILLHRNKLRYLLVCKTKIPGHREETTPFPIEVIDTALSAYKHLLEAKLKEMGYVKPKEVIYGSGQRAKEIYH